MKNTILIIAIIAIVLVSFNSNKKMTSIVIAKGERELRAYLGIYSKKGSTIVSITPYLADFDDKGGVHDCGGVYNNNFIIKVEY